MLDNGPAGAGEYDPRRVTDQHVSAALFLDGCMAISPELFGLARENLKKQVGERKISISALDKKIETADELSRNTDWESF